MLVTKRKRLRSDIEQVADYLPVWRFVQLRCFACSCESTALVPYDLNEYPVNSSECSQCGKWRVSVVGLVPEMQALPLAEAKREWARRRGEGWNPEFYPMLKALNCG